MLSCDPLSRRNVILSRRSCLIDAGRLVLQIFPVVQIVKNLPTMQETWVQSLGQEHTLEKGMVTHSSILAWRIPWTEKPGRLQSMESQRAGHDWVCMHTYTHTHTHKVAEQKDGKKLALWRYWAIRLSNRRKRLRTPHRVMIYVLFT